MSLTETRETPPTAKQRTIRQATRATVNTESERKKLQQRGQEKSRSLDNQTVGTAKRKQGQGKESYPLSREEPRQDRSLPTRPEQTPKEETQARTTEGEGRQEAKATECHTRDPTSTPYRSSRRGQKTVTKQPGPPEQVKDKQRNQKEDEP